MGRQMNAVVVGKKWQFSTSISRHRMLLIMRPSGVINTVLPDCGKLATHDGVC